ncbi:MAG TPA: hypothetical protein VIK18_09795 [Pirellulales bacterium]
MISTNLSGESMSGRFCYQHQATFFVVEPAIELLEVDEARMLACRSARLWPLLGNNSAR